MARTVDDILADELGKMGGFGSKWVARRLPTTGGEVRLEIAAPAEQVVDVAQRLLSDIGVLLAEERVPDLPALQAIVGAGGLGLNPTIVAIQVTPSGAMTSRVVVTGRAKEGLVKQHAGERAAQRIAQLIAAELA